MLKSKQKYLTSAAPPLASRPNSGEKPLDTFADGGYLCPRYSLIVQFQIFITMGRKNLILGNASGKLGDVVFYRDGGEQRFRTRVTPANPQSMAQQSQRSRLGGVTNTFRAAKGILADSFESKAVNQSGFNAFAASALPTAPYLSKKAAAAGGALPMPMAISKGSLPQVTYGFQQSTTEGSTEITGMLPVEGVSSTTTTTFGALSKALIAMKPCVYHEGAQVHITVIQYLEKEIDGENVYTPWLVDSFFVLDSESTELLSLGVNHWTITVGDGLVSFTLDFDGTPLVAAMFVADGTQNDGLHVSSADAWLSPAAETLYNAAIAEAARIAAAESYGGSNQRCVL